jgi:signal transduction histidine kinase
MTSKLALCALVLGLPFVAAAEDRATTKDAERMVHQAVEYFRSAGREAALAAFNDGKGKFAFRDLYIVAYDTDGKCLAHGAKKERVGKVNLQDKDADGRLFIQERVELAKKSGKGWQEYKWPNPATGKVEQKVLYFELVDGVIIGCGAYRP